MVEYGLKKKVMTLTNRSEVAAALDSTKELRLFIVDDRSQKLVSGFLLLQLSAGDADAIYSVTADRFSVSISEYETVPARRTDDASFALSKADVLFTKELLQSPMIEIFGVALDQEPTFWLCAPSGKLQDGWKKSKCRYLDRALAGAEITRFSENYEPFRFWDKSKTFEIFAHSVIGYCCARKLKHDVFAVSRTDLQRLNDNYGAFVEKEEQVDTAAKEPLLPIKSTPDRAPSLPTCEKEELASEKRESGLLGSRVVRISAAAFIAVHIEGEDGVEEVVPVKLFHSKGTTKWFEPVPSGKEVREVNSGAPAVAAVKSIVTLPNGTHQPVWVCDDAERRLSAAWNQRKKMRAASSSSSNTSDDSSSSSSSSSSSDDRTESRIKKRLKPDPKRSSTALEITGPIAKSKPPPKQKRIVQPLTDPSASASWAQPGRAIAVGYNLFTEEDKSLFSGVDAFTRFPRATAGNSDYATYFVSPDRAVTVNGARCASVESDTDYNDLLVGIEAAKRIRDAV